MSNIKRVVLGLIAVVGMVFIALAGFGSSATALPAAGVIAPTSPPGGSSLPGGYTSSGSGPTSVTTSPGTSSASSSSSGAAHKPSCTGSVCSGFDAESAVCVGTSPGSGDVDKGTASADGTFSGFDTSGVSAGTTLYVSPCGDTDAADAAQITVAGSNSSGSGGNLSSTGVAVIGIGAIGLVLLVGGALMLLAGRRRGGSHA